MARARKKGRDRATDAVPPAPTLSLVPPGTMVNPAIPPMPQTTSGLSSTFPAPSAGVPAVSPSPSGLGAWLPSLAAPTPSPGANMTKWLVPVAVFALTWWLTGGIGWALVAAVLAWFLAAWWAKRSAGTASATQASSAA